MALTIQQWKDTLLLPTSGQIAWHRYEFGVSGHNIIYDYSGNNRTLQCVALGAPVLQANVLYGNAGWYFGGAANPLFWTGAVAPKHIFILASNEEAAFTLNRGLLGGILSGDVLVSEAAGNEWTDLGLGADFVYRIHDVLKANNDLDAPMSGSFALMEIQSPSGIALDGIQVGRQRDFVARLLNGYFIEQLMFDRVLSATEIKRVLLYYNLAYSQYRDGLPFYFPSDDFMNFRRRRFYAEPPDFDKITDEYEFEDASKTFNEVGDTAPRRWEYDYRFVNSLASTDPPEVRIMDEFNAQARRVNPFKFADKYGTTHENVRIEDYQRTHDAHKPWIQNVRFKLIQHPS